MENKILARGEFSKPNAFISGMLGGLLLGVVLHISIWLIPTLIGGPSRLMIVNEIMFVIVLPIMSGYGNMNQKRELLITKEKIVVTIGKQTSEFYMNAITSYELKGQRLIIQAPPRKMVVPSLKNCQEISSVLNNLFNQRKNTPVYSVQPSPSGAHYGNADELKKYKELLDMGAITQDEFDKKKKELLHL